VVKDRETFNVGGGETWRMRGHDYIEKFYTALGAEANPRFSEVFTAVDWYDTSKSSLLDYQKTSFNQLEEKLKVLGEEYGLR
jgi:hypothetical protein